MTMWLFELLGPYVLQATSLIFTFLKTQLCISLFARNLKRRQFFLLRIVFFDALGIALFYGLAVYNTHADTLSARLLCYFTITVFCLLYTVGIFRGSIEDILIVFCSGEAAQQLTEKLYPLLQNLMGINDKTTISLIHPGGHPIEDWEWLLFFLYHIGMYLLLAHFLAPKHTLRRDSETARGVAMLSVSVIFTVNLLVCVSRTFEGENLLLSVISKSFAITLCTVILVLCSGLLTQSEKSRQMDILRQLWKQDQAQYESVKASMDAISMKCHDLKHVFNRIEGKLNQEELAQLQSAITMYDSRVETGNDVLNVVLSEKNLVCSKHGIQFSAMMDGSLLTFLTPAQTYTVFGNLMDNAIEAVQKLPEENRIITLSCQRTNEGVEIEESNYFDRQTATVNETMRTTKADVARHGFGIKSIQYIAQQHGGTVETTMQEDMFFLRIFFPTQK